MKHLLIMSLILIASAAIGEHRFDRIHAAEIETSWRTLGQTAEVKLPSYNKVLQKQIKTGDTVSISMGYENKGGLREEYAGFVSHIHRGIPVTIECEDYIYFLKRTNVVKTFKGEVQLKDIVAYILGEVNTKHEVSISLDQELLPDTLINNHRIDNQNAAQALEDLKANGVAIYLDGPTLYVHLPYGRNSDTIRYATDHNMVNFDGLKERSDDDKQVQVIATGITPDNKSIEVKAGTDGGNTINLKRHDIHQKAQLQIIADQELLKYQYDGLDGEFSSFLLPIIEHSNLAQITDNRQDPATQNTYFVDAVKKTYGTSSGGRRVIEIGIKV